MLCSSVADNSLVPLSRVTYWIKPIKASLQRGDVRFRDKILLQRICFPERLVLTSTKTVS